MADEDNEDNEKQDDLNLDIGEAKILGLPKKKFMMFAGIGGVVLLLLIMLPLVLMGGSDEPMPEAQGQAAAPAPAPAPQAPKADDALNADENDVARDQADVALAQQEALDANTGMGQSTIKGPALFYTIRPMFVVNFQSSRKAKYLQISVDVLTRNDSVIDDVIDNLPLIKNDLVTLFSAQKYDDIKTPEGKEQLRKEALSKVQSVLRRETGRAGVEDILFTSFVMQ